MTRSEFIDRLECRVIEIHRDREAFIARLRAAPETAVLGQGAMLSDVAEEAIIREIWPPMTTLRTPISEIMSCLEHELLALAERVPVSTSLVKNIMQEERRVALAVMLRKLRQARILDDNPELPQQPSQVAL